MIFRYNSMVFYGTNSDKNQVDSTRRANTNGQDRDGLSNSL